MFASSTQQLLTVTSQRSNFFAERLGSSLASSAKIWCARRKIKNQANLSTLVPAPDVFHFLQQRPGSLLA
jgi:hypothetical protein